MDSGFLLRFGGVYGFDSEGSRVFSGEESDGIEEDDFAGSGRDFGIGSNDALRSKSPGKDEG